MNRHYFLLRRLHSLTGILPIGVFLINHLLTNSTIAWGLVNSRASENVAPGTIEQVGEMTARRVGTFQHEVSFINDMPFLILIEVTLWVSIAFHAILGVYFARTGKSNTSRYAYQDNMRYTLQRLTGYIAIFYIFYHVATLRWGWTFMSPTDEPWSHSQAASTFSLALRGQAQGIGFGGILVSLFYFVGVTASVYHLANGLWTAAITWGLTISESAQRRWGYVCAGLGAGLMLMAWSSLIGFLLLDVDKARMIEADMHAAHSAHVETTQPVAEADH
jgi:succinate dehydrogenase / fumarate reductase cytochrome b subunit